MSTLIFQVVIASYSTLPSEENYQSDFYNIYFLILKKNLAIKMSAYQIGFLHL